MEKIEKLVIEPEIKENETTETEKEVFDPRLELEKIKKLPREEKREALDEYKEKLAEQKEGLADLQKILIKKIRENPDLPWAEGKEVIEEMARVHKMTEAQKDYAKRIFGNYRSRHQKIKEVRKKYSDDKELYKAAFGKEPEGKVEIIEGPMTLYFRCYDTKDYALIYRLVFLLNRELTEEDIEAANLSGGASVPYSLIPELEGAVIVENSQKTPVTHIFGTYSHEEQHVINKFFQEEETRASLGRFKFKDPERARLLFTRYFRLLREPAEDRAKDEILAYLKNGTSVESILRKLTKAEKEGGIYDYLKIIKERSVEEVLSHFQKKPEYLQIGQIAASEVLEKEYVDLLKQGLEAFGKLTKEIGYSTDRAMALLITEPLIKWPKVVRRLHEQSEKER